LPRPEHVLAAAEGPLAALPGSVVADLSTIDPGSARQAASLLQGHGVQYVDAPVLGRPDKIGAWTLPAGGPADAVDVIRSVLQGTAAKSVLHVGEAGAGSAITVLNNLMFGPIARNTLETVAVTAEALTASATSGPTAEAAEAFGTSAVTATVSNLFREIGPKI